MILTSTAESLDAIDAAILQGIAEAEAEAEAETEAQCLQSLPVIADFPPALPGGPPASVAPWMRARWRVSCERFVVLCRAEGKEVRF